MRKVSQADKLRRGLLTIGGLAALTALEYIISVMLPTGALIPLTIIAVVKAWLIIQYFMHVANLWRAESEE
jgi:hypothetical protein